MARQCFVRSKEKKPSIVKRDLAGKAVKFKATRPLQKIVTDVTYIKHREKWHYLSPYLALYNNGILEWELSDTSDNFLVIKPARTRLERAKSTPSPFAQ